MVCGGWWLQLAEQAEELQCVGNARDAACADQARLTNELADACRRIRELVRVPAFSVVFRRCSTNAVVTTQEGELNSKTSELAAQATVCKKQSIQVRVAARVGWVCNFGCPPDVTLLL
jgi:hypothetical protein